MDVWRGIASIIVVMIVAGCAPAAAPSPTAVRPADSAPAAPAKPTEAPAAAKPAPTSAQPAAAAPAAAAKDAAKKQVDVRLSHAGAQTFRLPLYVAIQNGYLKDEGINLQVVDTRSGSDAMKMLAGKAVELSTGQLLDAVNLNKEGINIQGVALLTNKLGNSIVVRKALAGQIKGMADLKGRTVGVTSVGSGTWQFAVYMGQLAGVKKDELNFVPVGTGADAIGALKSGRVDALSFADPENYQLVATGDAEFLIDMTNAETHQRLIGSSYLNNQIMVSADYAKSNPEAVQGFVNAIQRGLNWANANSTEEVAKLLSGYSGFQGMNQELLVASLRRQANAVPKSAVITKDTFDNAMKFPLAIGVLTEAMPYEQVVNTAFAEKAAKEHPPKP